MSQMDSRVETLTATRRVRVHVPSQRDTTVGAFVEDDHQHNFIPDQPETVAHETRFLNQQEQVDERQNEEVEHDGEAGWVTVYVENHVARGTYFGAVSVPAHSLVEELKLMTREKFKLTRFGLDELRFRTVDKSGQPHELLEHEQMPCTAIPDRLIVEYGEPLPPSQRILKIGFMLPSEYEHSPPLRSQLRQMTVPKEWSLFDLKVFVLHQFEAPMAVSADATVLQRDVEPPVLLSNEAASIGTSTQHCERLWLRNADAADFDNADGDGPENNQALREYNEWRRKMNEQRFQDPIIVKPRTGKVFRITMDDHHDNQQQTDSSPASPHSHPNHEDQRVCTVSLSASKFVR